jgi:hypothetical protein
MFAISFAMLFGVAFISLFNGIVIVKNPRTKNVLTWVMCGCNSILSFTIAWFMIPDSMWAELLVLLADPRLGLLMALEFFGLLFTRRNFTHNHDNLTAINFSMFLSVVYVPILAYLFNDMLGFQNTLTVNYASDREFLLFVSGMLCLVALFFSNKLKGHVNHWGYLLFTPLMLSFCMFVAAKMNQSYNGFLVFAVVGTFNSIIFGALIIQQREYRHIGRGQINGIVKIASASSLFVPLNTIALGLVAVEFFAILKRVSQITCARLFDAKSNNSKPLSIQDTVIVILMLVFGLSFYILRS